MDNEKIKDVHQILHTDALDDTFEKIKNYVESYNKGINDPNVRRPPILRILLLSFGSGVWCVDSNDMEKSKMELLKFLMKMKSLMRRSLAVCTVFMPQILSLQFEGYKHCFDQSISITSFDGQKNPQFPGYDGTLTLERTITLFSCVSWKSECRQYLFRRTRRTMQVEKLYMPPEDSAQSDLACATTGGGGGRGGKQSGKANGLDF